MPAVSAPGGRAGPAVRRLTRRRAVALLAAAGAALGSLGALACRPARLERREPGRGLVLRVNVHGSAAYAPLHQLRERRLLERTIPGLTVEWKAIPSAEAINDALATGGLDLAAGPPTAFLLARESGLPARLVAGLCALPCAVVGRSGLRSLGALPAGDRVAVPDPVSFEAAVLELAALRELGDPFALAGRTVQREHADALAALEAGRDLAAHASVTPYLDIELERAGPTVLVDGRDLFDGPASTALVYALPSLRERHGAVLDAFASVLADAARLAASDPIGTARLLVEAEELQVAPERLAQVLARSAWQPGPRLAGVTRIAELWRRTDRLRRVSPRWEELAFEGVEGG